jgi:hypothetical protein
MKAEMTTGRVAAKVWAASLAALLVPILLGLLKMAWPEVPLPGNADTLMEDVLLAIITAVSTLATGYAKPPHPEDTVTTQ